LKILSQHPQGWGIMAFSLCKMSHYKEAQHC
jgi:predicted glutamine amidotransferase